MKVLIEKVFLIERKKGRVHYFVGRPFTRERIGTQRLYIEYGRVVSESLEKDVPGIV